MDIYFICYELQEAKNDVFYHAEGYATAQAAREEINRYPESLRAGMGVYHVVIERVDEDGRLPTSDGSHSS